MSLLVRTGQNGANHGDQRSETRAMLGGLMVRKVVAITALLALTAACGTRVKGGQAAQELKADAAAAGLSGGSGTGGGDQGGVPPRTRQWVPRRPGPLPAVRARRYSRARRRPWPPAPRPPARPRLRPLRPRARVAPPRRPTSRPEAPPTSASPTPRSTSA